MRDVAIVAMVSATIPRECSIELKADDIAGFHHSMRRVIRDALLHEGVVLACRPARIDLPRRDEQAVTLVDWPRNP